MSPEPTHERTRIDARTTAWLIAQRERVRELELAQARLQGELSASERIERASERYTDKLEEKLAEARKREASLARALGYAEAQRDLLATRLGEGPKAALPELQEVELRPARPAARPPVARKS
jgi:predicted RNase H-like nuclease (RuvC/YqgF family)